MRTIFSFYVLIFSSLLIVRSADAQHVQPIRLGVVGGFQSSVIRGSVVSNGLVGLHLGGVAEASLTERFGLRVQPQLSMKGGKIQGTFRESLLYAELPIWGTYQYDIGTGHLVGGIGPYVGWLLNGRIDGDKMEVGTDVRGLDAGISLMGGFAPVDSPMSFHVFWSSGIATISPPNPYDIKATNRTIGFTVTYFLGWQ